MMFQSLLGSERSHKGCFVAVIPQTALGCPLKRERFGSIIVLQQVLLGKAEGL